MKQVAKASVAALTLIARGAAQTAPTQNPPAISIARSESLQTTKGAAQFFTGPCRSSSCFPATIPPVPAVGK